MPPLMDVTLKQFHVIALLQTPFGTFITDSFCATKLSTPLNFRLLNFRLLNLACSISAT